MSELHDWLEEFFQRIKGNGDIQRRRTEQRRRRIRRLLQDAIVRSLWERVPQEEIDRAVKSELPVRETARGLIENILNKR